MLTDYNSSQLTDSPLVLPGLLYLGKEYLVRFISKLGTIAKRSNSYQLFDRHPLAVQHLIENY